MRFSTVTGRMAKGSLKKSEIGTLAPLTLIVGSIFVMLCFWILTVRIQSVLEDSRYAQSTGAEFSPLYGIYKAWMGAAVYQPVHDDPTATLYNYLFYYGYGLAGKFLINNPEAFPLGTRLLTLAGVFGFLIVMFYYVWCQSRRLVVGRNSRVIRAVVLLFPIAAYLGPFTGWFYLSARPDLIAAGLELTALIMFLRFIESDRSKSIVPITLVFWLGWSMKQAAVFVWLGTLAAMGMKQRWKGAVISLTMFLLLTSIPYQMFGRPYIDLTIIVPTMFPWRWQEVIRWASDAFLIGSYIYVPALFFGVKYLIDKKGKESTTLGIVLVILAISLAGNFLLTGKIGSGRYYYFSSFLVGQLFVVQYLVSGWPAMDDARKCISMIMVFIGFSLGIGLSSLYLLFPNQLGRIELMTSQERVEASRLTQIIYSAAKPVFVEASYYALPWNSGQYPSDVINWTFFGVTRGSRFGFPLEGRIRDRYYAEAFVYDGEWSERFARSGYKRTSRVGSINHFVRQ